MQFVENRARPQTWIDPQKVRHSRPGGDGFVRVCGTSPLKRHLYCITRGMLLPKFRQTRKKGLALLETVAAVAMVGSFIAILITMSSNLLGLLRTSKDNISASQNLQQRVEQL